MTIDTIEPLWEGNQVWFILGGGAIFAAWPLLYAAAFSGFYLAMLLVLLALILRPVGFAFRNKTRPSRAGATCWDWALSVGGVVPSLMFGVAFGNLFLGVPFHFDDSLRSVYDGSFFGLLHPFALLCGRREPGDAGHARRDLRGDEDRGSGRRARAADRPHRRDRHAAGVRGLRAVADGAAWPRARQRDRRQRAVEPAAQAGDAGRRWMADRRRTADVDAACRGGGGTGPARCRTAARAPTRIRRQRARGDGDRVHRRLLAVSVPAAFRQRPRRRA